MLPWIEWILLIVAPCLVHWWIRYTCRSEKFYVHTQPSRSWHTVENFIAFWRLLATDEHVESLGMYFYCRLQLGPGWSLLNQVCQPEPNPKQEWLRKGKKKWRLFLVGISNLTNEWVWSRLSLLLLSHWPNFNLTYCMTTCQAKRNRTLLTSW